MELIQSKKGFPVMGSLLANIVLEQILINGIQHDG